MSEKLKITRGSGNVFRDIGFDKDEAENLKLRSELMIRIESFYEKSGMTQAQAARLLGLTAPRFNALLKADIERAKDFWRDHEQRTRTRISSR
jgi:predicted XRE-type DNA-binding protein